MTSEKNEALKNSSSESGGESKPVFCVMTSRTQIFFPSPVGV